MYNPNRNIIEDRKSNEEYQVKDMQTIMYRIRLSVDIVEYCVWADSFVFNYYYPRFSHLCWLLMHIAINYFRAEYFLTYILVGLIWMVLAYSEFWKRNVTPVMNKVFFAPHLLNSKISSMNNVITQDQITIMKNMQKVQ